MNEINFEEIQKQQTAWSQRNFGDQPAYRPLLGIIEELCELQEAWDKKDKPEIIDAIGDVGVYMLDYCGRRGWSFQELWDKSATVDIGNRLYWNLVPTIRKLAHHQLKGEQKIRGGAEEHDCALKEQLEMTFYLLERISDSMSTHFPEVLAEVWVKVSKRDWVQNPNNAHEVAEGS